MKLFIFLSVITYSSILFTNNSHSQMTWNQGAKFIDSGYIAVSHSAVLNITGSFTIEMWINPFNVGTQTLIQKRSGATGYTLYLTSNRVAIRTNSLTRLISRNPIPYSQWTHVAASFSSTPDVFRIFINGQLDTTSTIASAEPLANTDSLKIGLGLNGEYVGKLDEIRIWDYAKTNETNIQTDMRLSLATNSHDPGLVLSLPFQHTHPSGTLFSLKDRTSYDNDVFNRGVTAEDMSNAPSNTIAINECVNLTAATDYLAGPDHVYLSPTQGITVEAWVYPTSFNANDTVTSTIVHKGNSSGSITNYRLALNGNRVDFYINNFRIFRILSSDGFIPLNKWTHIAFTYSASNGFMTFIRNGEIRWENTYPIGNIGNGSDSLYVGGTPSLENFNGYIDELRIVLLALPYGTIGNRVFTSVNASNDGPVTNVAFNFDGTLLSNSHEVVELFFRKGAHFSHSAYNDNTPVSPLTNSADLNFQNGFYINNPGSRIPAIGTSGFMISDTLDIPISETVSDINVFVAVNHTNEINLIMSLISPTGNSVMLFGAQSLLGNSDNVVTIFDDQADSTLSGTSYVMFTPVIKPDNNMNTFTGSNTFGKWKLRIQDLSPPDTGTLVSWGIQFNNQIKKKPVLSLSALIQGFYDASINSMVPDTLRVYIRNVNSPFSIYDSSKAWVGSLGKANFIFNNVPDGEPVFIQIKHRNSIETWSKYTGIPNKINCEEYFHPFTSTLKYDLTNSQGTAFGDNLKQVDTSPVEYAIYSGDPNQDGTVDAGDLILIYNDALIFASGYMKSDVNGDNFTDVSDLIITYNNSINFVSVIRP